MVNGQTEKILDVQGLISIWWIYVLVWLGRWLGSFLQEHLQTIIPNGTLHFLHLEESYNVGLHLKTKTNTTKPHLGFRLTPLSCSPSKQEFYRPNAETVIMINTDHMTYKETGIMLFRENTLPCIISPCLFEESGFESGVFLFWFYSVFWEQQPSILKADTANGTFRIYCILDRQASVSFLNTHIHYFIQPLARKPYSGETGQCANSTIMFTSICEGFLCCVCCF